MAYFNKNNQSGGNRNFGKPRFSSDRPQLHQATCATCGKSCEVPFKPTGSKPVYCRDCFRNNEGSDFRGSENRNDRQMHDAVCSNCGNNCKIPFRPTAGRDVLCSNCFEKNGPIDTRKPFEKQNFTSDARPQRTNDAPNYKAQFEALNAKMDKILDILHSAMAQTPAEEVAVEEVVAEIPTEKIEKVEKKPKKTVKKVTKKKAAPKKK
jgi:CxxC-x17-CxxC domain-containing protein